MVCLGACDLRAFRVNSAITRLNPAMATPDFATMQSLKDLITTAPRVPMPFCGQVHRVVPGACNRVTATWHREEIVRSKNLLDAFDQQLKHLDQSYKANNGTSIRTNLHFVYGLKKREFFPYFAKLAVLSAMHHNPGWGAFFHYREEPFGPHWDSVKPRH